MKNKKAYIQISFPWIFAIIAGVFILFLAIYGVTKFVGISKFQAGAQGAMGLKVLTGPLESSVESATRVLIDSGGEARIYSDCSNFSLFGEQRIRTAQKMMNDWEEKEQVEVIMENRYIFAKEVSQGRLFYVFSKPFEMPFKVSDLIYLTSSEDKYCFVNAPRDVVNELNYLIGETRSENENFFIERSKSNCPSKSVSVCFDLDDCDVFVSTAYGRKFVQKPSSRVYYEGDALMYAAIFSEKRIYECQVKRLMNRTEQLYGLYYAKSRFIYNEVGCESGMESELNGMINLLRGYKESIDLREIMEAAESVRHSNEYSRCRLW